MARCMRSSDAAEPRSESGVACARWDRAAELSWFACRATATFIVSTPSRDRGDRDTQGRLVPGSAELLVLTPGGAGQVCQVDGSVLGCGREGRYQGDVLQIAAGQLELAGQQVKVYVRVERRRHQAYGSTMAGPNEAITGKVSSAPTMPRMSIVITSPVPVPRATQAGHCAHDSR